MKAEKRIQYLNTMHLEIFFQYLSLPLLPESLPADTNNKLSSQKL